MVWLFWLLASVVLVFGFVVFRGAPYVPSHKKEVRRAFTDLYKLSSKDILIDVGSGDGVILRLASSKGAQARGYELNPVLVLISRFLSRRDEKVKTYLRDFWLTKLPENTTVVYAFTVTRDIEKMAHKIQTEANRLGRTLYFISYGSWIEGRTQIKEVGAHHLYKFDPLQEEKP
jgi:hypothetical protein